MPTWQKVSVPELLIPDLDNWDLDHIYGGLENREKAAITRATKKLLAGDHRLTKYERDCLQMYEDLNGLILCSVPCETSFKNGD